MASLPYTSTAATLEMHKRIKAEQNHPAEIGETGQLAEIQFFMLGNKADIVKQDDQKAGWQHSTRTASVVDSITSSVYGIAATNRYHCRRPNPWRNTPHACQSGRSAQAPGQTGRYKKDQHDRQQAQPDNGRQNACFHTGLVSFQQQFGTIYSYAKARRNLPE